MSRYIDVVGQKFNKLTVIKDLGISCGTQKRNYHYVKCKCDCGNEVVVDVSNLIRGNTKSCGCIRKYNEYYIYNDITFVKFSNCNEYFICDTEDWLKLKDYCWAKNANGYAISWIDRKSEFMHRLITKCPDDKVVDHIYQISNGICDNRKSNLRVCTQKENLKNQKIHSSNKSGFSGVYWDNARGKWRVQISYNGKRVNLGRFDNFKDAVKARLNAETVYVK